MAQASCGFAVTVHVSQALAKARFVAFGDSITAGVVSLAPFIMLSPPHTYPVKLQQMLGERYPAQNLVVINRGESGEDTRGGARRLPGVLDADTPEVLLLLEGINNLGAATSTQVTALRTMITEAQGRGVDVIIATVMPVLPTWKNYQPGVTIPRITALNTQIHALAAQYALGPPVDLYAIFLARPELIGTDGLHPTANGQTEIARAFRDEIVGRYDTRSMLYERSTLLQPFFTMAGR
jgi:lysophospholipase L1-like esterase